MDSELLTSSLSKEDVTFEGSERKMHSPSLTPYTDVFNKKFPFYLAIGMTEEQYWDKDCLLVKHYKKADEIRTERANQEAWLQGMYFYDALIRVSPIFRAFAKKGTKAEPYLKEAYPLGKEAIEKAKMKKEKINHDKAMRYMQAYMVQYNKNFEERK